MPIQLDFFETKLFGECERIFRSPIILFIMQDLVNFLQKLVTHKHCLCYWILKVPSYWKTHPVTLKYKQWMAHFKKCSYIVSVVTCEKINAYMSLMIDLDLISTLYSDMYLLQQEYQRWHLSPSLSTSKPAIVNNPYEAKRLTETSQSAVSNSLFFIRACNRITI